jgi:hypothetical protein
LIAIGFTGVVGGIDFSGEWFSWVDDVLLAGEALGGRAVGGLWDGEEVVRLSGPNGGPFDNTEGRDIPGIPLCAPKVLW